MKQIISSYPLPFHCKILKLKTVFEYYPCSNTLPYSFHKSPTHKFWLKTLYKDFDQFSQKL